MVVLNYLTTLTRLRNGRFWWEDSEILQNAHGFYGQCANMPNSEGNSGNFPFGNTLNVNCCTKWGQGAKFHQ